MDIRRNQTNFKHNPQRQQLNEIKNRYCRSCGSKADCDSIFCHICGTELKSQLNKQEEKSDKITKVILEDRNPFSQCYSEFRFNLKGVEKVESPITLSTDYYSYSFMDNGYCLTISNADFPLELNKICLKRLYLVNCKNFLISKARIKDIKLVNCSNIKLQEVSVKRKIILDSCIDIRFIKSNGHKFKIQSCDKILMVKCKIHRLLRTINTKIEFLESQIDKEKIFDKNFSFNRR